MLPGWVVSQKKRASLEAAAPTPPVRCLRPRGFLSVRILTSFPMMLSSFPLKTRSDVFQRTALRAAGVSSCPRCAQRNMAQETNHSQAPMLCSTGCGFYGNPRTNGMCSVCYREHLQRQNSSNGRISPPAASVTSLSESFPVQRADGSAPDAQSPLDPAPASAQPSPVSNQSLLSESVASSQADGTSVEGAPDTEDLPASVSDTAQQPSEEQSESLEKPKQRKNRCFMCRKKVGLTGFECRCGHVYCGVHRYSDVHNCSYNYKADAAEKIRKENPVVVGEKIQKI
uniref:AN1-type zinc finger protein 6 n=1 Tax=Suricata suricatta TaxID=37032 RepID=A0A673TL77_SURSU